MRSASISLMRNQSSWIIRGWGLRIGYITDFFATPTSSVGPKSVGPISGVFLWPSYFAVTVNKMVFELWKSILRGFLILWCAVGYEREQVRACGGWVIILSYSLYNKSCFYWSNTAILQSDNLYTAMYEHLANVSSTSSPWTFFIFESSKWRKDRYLYCFVFVSSRRE